MSAGRYLDRLAARTERVRTSLCLGIDPDPGAMPENFSDGVADVERFATLVLEAGLPFAAAVKVNLAFFEAYGSAGLAALERVRRRVPADIPFIADAKRADIGSTSARQAVALFDVLEADAVTVNPYLGRTAIGALLDRRDRFAYVLCRTSNPGAAELQDLDVAGEPLFVHVARRVTAWHEAGDGVGLVVGATAPAELARVRHVAPALPFLVPGVGAQGGDAATVMRDGGATAGAAASARGRGLLVNVSRAIASAARSAADEHAIEAAVAEAAREWSDVLRC